MQRIVDAPRLRDELSRGARAQAREFTWEVTADRTVEVYRAAARSMRDDLADVSA
jgi:D-inositol-3-phosphate glycosyltransferase